MVSSPVRSSGPADSAVGTTFAEFQHTQQVRKESMGCSAVHCIESKLEANNAHLDVSTSSVPSVEKVTNEEAAFSRAEVKNVEEQSKAHCPSGAAAVGIATDETTIVSISEYQGRMQENLVVCGATKGQATEQGLVEAMAAHLPGKDSGLKSTSKSCQAKSRPKVDLRLKEERRKRHRDLLAFWKEHPQMSKRSQPSLTRHVATPEGKTIELCELVVAIAVVANKERIVSKEWINAFRKKGMWEQVATILRFTAYQAAAPKLKAIAGQQNLYLQEYVTRVLSKLQQAEGECQVRAVESCRLPQKDSYNQVNGVIPFADLIPEEGYSSPTFAKAVHSLATSVKEKSAVIIQLTERDAEKLKCGSLMDSLGRQSGLIPSNMERWRNHPLVQAVNRVLGKVCRIVLDGLATFHGFHTPAFVDMLDPVPLRPQMVPSSLTILCNEDFPSQEIISMPSRTGFLTAIVSNHMRIMVLSNGGKYIEVEPKESSVLLLCGHALRHATQGKVQASQFNLVKQPTTDSQPKFTIIFHLMPTPTALANLLANASPSPLTSAISEGPAESGRSFMSASRNAQGEVEGPITVLEKAGEKAVQSRDSVQQSETKICLSVKLVSSGFSWKFQFPLTTPLSVLMTAFCVSAGVNIKTVAFLHRGRSLKATESAASYDLQNGEQLDVVLV